MNGELAEFQYEEYLRYKHMNNAPRLGAAGTYLVASPFTLGLLDIPSPRESVLGFKPETEHTAEVAESPEPFDIRSHMKDLGRRAVTPLGEQTLAGYASER